jgi:hypothetical protein
VAKETVPRIGLLLGPFQLFRVAGKAEGTACIVLHEQTGLVVAVVHIVAGGALHLVVEQEIVTDRPPKAGRSR